ncbi:MAG TPA: DUF4450 domain-containing protein [Anaerohalosphaeraceae bacterium]|nr:DUF4450 domain-containing protein [Anaerohalosphaeraceae bacterium]
MHCCRFTGGSLLSRSILMLGMLTAGVVQRVSGEEYNPPERVLAERPTMEGHTARPLRYRPEGRDFVIENGPEFFNRPLYGGNTAFRADAGDKPEISLYLPGHGGNVRFGIRTKDGIRCLNEARRIVSRYRAGSMVYEIEDPLLPNGSLVLTVLALYEKEGILVKAELQAEAEPCEWLAAAGGASGRRGRRGGDIGCETEPVSEFFRFRPEFCRENVFSIRENSFVLSGRVGSLAGFFSPKAAVQTADGRHWDNLEELAASGGGASETPVAFAAVPLQKGKAAYFLLYRVASGEQAEFSGDLASLFERTEQHRRQIAGRVLADTPDPFLNAAVSALCAAADGIWDEPQGAVMHGAAAWRTALAGWRGAYANDALGWHERARRYLRYWAQRQNLQEAAAEPGPDPASNLSRSHPAKQSRGDIGGRHYDMNLVYVDALFRHLMWTGDLALAEEELWPVLERHFEWERRLFRRPFGPERLPLYEAYAAIWASDDLQYSGGGVTHASAYNYYHNRLAARLARRLGKSPRPYEREAEQILKAMRRYLWLGEDGWYAEWKDWLGLQQTHPSAALWTFYHTIDCGAADPMQAWQMSRFVDTQIAHIPIHGPQIPQGLYYTLPTTNWMPYTWSTNNVVMAETAHTALAYWQLGRPEKAFSLLKGCILDSMYMGLCPGNLGMTTYFDMARGEAQRDFGDAVGIVSRAVIEGLFGIRPNALEGRLVICPGFPAEWEWARLRHPDVVFAYQRKGFVETFSIRPLFSCPLNLILQIPARGTDIEQVSVNGRSALWKVLEDSVGAPTIEITPRPADAYEVQIVWKGPVPVRAQTDSVAAQGEEWTAKIDSAKFQKVFDPQGVLDKIRVRGTALEGRTVGKEGRRTVFAEVQQGRMKWLEPLALEVRPAVEIIPSVNQEPRSIRFRIRNNTGYVFSEAAVTVGTWHREQPLWVPAYGLSEEIVLSDEEVPPMPGSNRVIVKFSEGRHAEGLVVNWKLSLRPKERMEAVHLAEVFNEQLRRIFQNEYISPRSPFCSLSIPKQGIGSWCDFAKTFEVDDSGLRRCVQEQGGLYRLPQGIVFEWPADPQDKNIVFVSRWENFPDEITIPLSGQAAHLYLLMAGSTNSMQSRIDNGEVLVTYADGRQERLALHNPTTWWPIDQDYFLDDYGFRRPEPIPPRVYLRSGRTAVYDVEEFKGKGGTVPGGAATVLDIPLEPDKALRSLTVRALANEVIIGVMAAVLVR